MGFFRALLLSCSDSPEKNLGGEARPGKGLGEEPQHRFLALHSVPSAACRPTLELSAGVSPTQTAALVHS